MLLSFNILANWFPRKRGVALGIATAGFPLSAATTTAICSRFAANIGQFYLVYGIIAIVIAVNLTSVRALHYISFPLLAIVLGGSSNIMTSTTAAIWGRYDFQNAFRVIQPLNAIMTGIGVTVVGIVGTNTTYFTAYLTMLILQIIAAIAMITLKVEPIDKDVR